MKVTAKKSWIKVLVRASYSFKGIIYGLIGILAFQLAIGSGGALEGAAGALKTISQQPLGRTLLTIVAFGLFAYAIWRLVQGFVDPENEGHDFTHVIYRIGYVFTGIWYGFLGIIAIQILSGSGGGSSHSEEITAKVMSVPFGRLFIGLAGATIIGVGIAQIWFGYDEKFKELLKLAQMRASVRRWSVRLGKFGLMARGVVYGIIGIFLIKAALNYNPQQAGGLAKALAELLSQPYGPWLLGITALGFVAYGLYSQVEALYRRMQV